jgi:hypothetical protein
MWKSGIIVTALSLSRMPPAAADAPRAAVVAGTLTTQVVACPSLCTESVWTGKLAGSSRFTLISLEDEQIPNANISRFHGDLVLSTPDGDLIGQDSGVWNLDTGEYVDLYTVTSGTGKLAGARGAIVLSGTLDPATGVGISRYRGVVVRGPRGHDGAER